MVRCIDSGANFRSSEWQTKKCNNKKKKEREKILTLSQILASVSGSDCLGKGDTNTNDTNGRKKYKDVSMVMDPHTTDRVRQISTWGHVSFMDWKSNHRTQIDWANHRSNVCTEERFRPKKKKPRGKEIEVYFAKERWKEPGNGILAQIKQGNNENTIEKEMEKRLCRILRCMWWVLRFPSESSLCLFGHQLLTRYLHWHLWLECLVILFLCFCWIRRSSLLFTLLPFTKKRVSRWLIFHYFFFQLFVQASVLCE